MIRIVCVPLQPAQFLRFARCSPAGSRWEARKQRRDVAAWCLGFADHCLSHEVRAQVETMDGLSRSENAACHA